MAKFVVINGPNLNLLGEREPAVYGRNTLALIESRLGEIAVGAGHELDSFQSNSEGALIDRVQEAARANCDCAVINPGGFTHTSVALRDALSGTGLAFIEVHLSNIAAREAFRQTSYFSDIALGTIAGFGAHGYELALAAAIRRSAAA